MEFDSLEDLHNTFIAGNLKHVPEILTVEGVEYTRNDTYSSPIVEMAETGCKSFVKFCPTEDENGDAIVLAWGMTSKLSIIPTSTALIQQNQSINENQKIISDQVTLDFPRFGKSVQGKVDTGAAMSSLHADHWEWMNGKKRVQAQVPMLSSNNLQFDVVDYANIRTSEGTDIRPVIELDVTVDGVEISKAKFNLNDRSEMNDPILVGQNVLEQGNFLIDPGQIREGTGWESIQTVFEDVSADDVDLISEPDYDRVVAVYQELLESDVSLQDIMRHLKTIALQNIEETIEY